MHLKGVKSQLDNLTNNEKKIIDKYYGEGVSEVVSDKDFQDKLKASILKMNLPKDNEDNIPNNFFAIINNAEAIKAKRSLLKETIMFIVAASLILFIFAVSILIIGQRFLIITEITIFILLPLSLIPFAKNEMNRGESK
jgi:hypothetical protein